MSATHGRTGDNWIVREAARADAREDRVVLENPNTVASLDAKLRSTFYPFVRAELEKTGFRYLPVEKDLHIESEWLGPNFARVLSFMLFDEFDPREHGKEVNVGERQSAIGYVPFAGHNN